MKLLASLALAAAFSLGLAASSNAAPTAYDYEADMLEAAPGLAGPALSDPYHHCHGKASGTAHASCGTATGGPSGGLF